MTDLVSLTARGFNTEITNVKIRKCCFWIFYKSESDQPQVHLFCIYWFKSYEIEDEFTYMTFLYDIYSCKNYAFYLVDPV